MNFANRGSLNKLFVVLLSTLLIAFLLVVKAEQEDLKEINKIESSDVLLERSAVSQTNSTIVQLFSGYKVSSASLAAYAWNYFYLDAYDTSATIEISAKGNGAQLYIQTSSLPTQYSYTNMYYLTSYSSTKTISHYAYNYKRYYIAIRNPNYFVLTGGYSFSVNVKSSSSPSKPYVDNHNCYQRNSFGLVFGLSFPMSLIVFVLFVTAISLMVVVRKQRRRIEELEKTMKSSQAMSMPLPVIPPQQLPTMVMPQNYIPNSSNNNNAQEQHTVDDRSEISTFTSAPIIIAMPPQQMNSNNMMGNQTPYGFPVYYPPMMYPQIYQQPQQQNVNQNVQQQQMHNQEQK
ncbi:hypothetical protein ABK040_013936 [Willaertia magna]